MTPTDVSASNPERALVESLAQVAAEAGPLGLQPQPRQRLLIASQAVIAAAASAAQQRGAAAPGDLAEALQVLAQAHPGDPQLEALLAIPLIEAPAQLTPPDAIQSAYLEHLEALVRRMGGPRAPSATRGVPRWFWIGVAAFTMVLAGAGSAYAWRAAHAPKSVNLARGRHVEASSQFRDFQPKGVVDGSESGIGVHTARQEEPWVTVDLGAPKPIHEIVVFNSTHCCMGRVVPLALEVSEDGKSWRTVARQDEVFRKWRADFAPTQARYVRARVLRTSLLHLSEIEVY